MELLKLGITSSRRYLRSAYTPSYATWSIKANVYPYNCVDEDRRTREVIRHYSALLLRGATATPRSPSLMILTSNNHRCPRRELLGYDGQKSYRKLSYDSKTKTNHDTNDLPFFKNPEKLPPSSSSILKQEDHELSAAEVRLKKALQTYMFPSENENIDVSEYEVCEDGDYLLEELQRAYMDLEYWEEALQIEVYKCHTYLSEGTDAYADSIHAQGKFYLRQEDFIESEKLYKKALDYFERTENLVQQGHVLISLSGWYFFRNQLEDALESLQQAETMLDSNPALLYKCLDNQGLIYRLCGEFHVALDKYEQALQVVPADDTETRFALRMHIADMYLALEESNDALKVYENLLMEMPPTSIANSEQYQLGMRGVLLHNIATIHVDHGEHQLALEEFREALEAKKLAGGEHNPEVAKTLNSLGALHAGSFGEKEVALQYFKEALLIARIYAEDKENPHDDPDVMNALQNISVIEQDLEGVR